MIDEFFRQAFLALLISILLAPLLWWINSRLEKAGRESKGDENNEHAERSHLARKALMGFSLSVAAAAVWGLSNAATRYSAAPYKDAVFEIAWLQFLGGAIAVLIIGLFSTRTNNEDHRISLAGMLSRVHIASAIVMAMNTYAFALGVSLVSAGTIATLENMQVVWIVFILIFVFSTYIAARWILSSVIAIIGAFLITDVSGVFAATPTWDTEFGFILGAVAGLTFAVYTVLWSQARMRNADLNFRFRTFELCVMISLTTILLVPIHLIYSYIAQTEFHAPFQTLPSEHIVIQFGVGASSLGLTYILINESLQVLRGATAVRALLVGLGMSYAVFFTLVFEFVIFGDSVSFEQWCGVVLFSLGFMLVWSEINDRV